MVVGTGEIQKPKPQYSDLSMVIQTEETLLIELKKRT